MMRRAVCRMLSVISSLMIGLGIVIVLPASADTNTGTLHLWCEEDGVILEDMEWEIYRVGSRDGDAFRLEGDFSHYAITLGDPSVPMDQWDADDLNASAFTLWHYSQIDDIPCVASGKTDQEGKVDFPGLTDGLYLVCGSRMERGNTTYIPSPLFFEMNGQPENNLNAFPKIEELTLEETVAEYSVRKVWANDENQPWDRSTSITVELYKNGVLANTVVLNEENDWRYDWTDQMGEEWFVKEKIIPPHYTVSVSGNLTQYIIVNTYNNTFDSSSTDTTSTVSTDVLSTDTQTTEVTVSTDQQTKPTFTTVKQETQTPMSTITSVSETTQEKLPQTGQLWWPVLPLAGGGLFLLTIGLRRKDKDE